MNWIQIASEALDNEPNVPDSAVRELADDLALTAQAFVLDQLPRCRQEAIDEASK